MYASTRLLKGRREAADFIKQTILVYVLGDEKVAKTSLGGVNVKTLGW